ncbi:MAG: hypothetical protein AB7O96_01520 [Pseudobdellovibrionaceae bacterium]
MDPKSWAGLLKFLTFPKEQKKICVYAEDRYDWKHLGPLVEELTARGQTLCYVTSDLQDPIFKKQKQNLSSLYIGSGTARTVFFSSLNVGQIIMTMPDLQSFHIKRSRCPVRYIYVFHSIVSTHMIYREQAFDAYDTVFCVGPHHVHEIRQREKLFNLKQKELIEFGYSYLDELLKNSSPSFSKENNPTVLVAPSWGPSSITAVCLEEVLDLLVEHGYKTIFRPHPMSIRTENSQLRNAQNKFEKNEQVHFDFEPSSKNSFDVANVLITEWSGSALEFSFAQEKPVMFIDLPRKVNNPEYEKLQIEPLEAIVREQLGSILNPKNLKSELLSELALVTAKAAKSQQIREARSKWIFNAGQSAKIGVDHILQYKSSMR